jgi:acyl transferase domain-containing protein
MDNDIAIIGMSGRFPGSSNIDQFWENLKLGKESITFFSDQELLASGVDPSLLSDPRYVKAAATLDDIDLFDAKLFNIGPREAEVMDPQHRIFLECAWEALESAGYDPDRYTGTIGVYGGAGLNTYYLANLLGNRGVMESVGGIQVVISNDKDFVVTRASYKLNLRGPSVAVQTACSTSLVATHLACQSLLIGECDMALAGGVTIMIPQKNGYLYQEGGIASPDGRCRAFDENAAGGVVGSGIGIVALKRLKDAQTDGDNILAVIKGSAINNDGAMKVGYTAPSVEGQMKVIAEAQAVARIDSSTISYIEAHGTGTVIGDPIEVAALTQVFRASTDKKSFCAIGSVKTNIGHLDTASGIAGLIKTVLALKHKMIPPSLHFHRPNPQIDFQNSPFYVNTELRSWETTSNPRRAGINSFGIGGTNAHLILEEAPQLQAAPQSPGPHLLLLSERSDASLDAAASRLAQFLKDNPSVSLANVAFTLQEGRKPFSHRMCLVCSDLQEAIDALTTGSGTYRAVDVKSPPKVVFMFPGQGAQYVGMGSGLYDKQPRYREVIELCSDVACQESGIDLSLVLKAEADGRARELLKETMVTQIALFAVELGLARMWMSKGVRPEAMIGHSLGEYVAACVAGVMSDEQGARLVARRGRLMQEARRGGMLAVGMCEREARLMLEREGSSLQVGAVNGPSQCVLSGEMEEIAHMEELLERQGIGGKRLMTSHAFHSRHMEEVSKEYVKEVRGVRMREPEVRYVSNVSGKWASGEEINRPEYWGEQMREMVKYWDGLERIREEIAGRVMLEVGPGNVLSKIARQSYRGEGEEVISMLGAARGDEWTLLEAAGRMWTNGVEVDWQQMRDTGTKCRREMLPGHVFEREKYWIEVGRGEQARGPLGKREDISEWFYVPVWKETVALQNGKENSRRKVWMVVKGEGEDGAIGEEMAQGLEEAGEEVIRVIEGRKQEMRGGNEYRVRAGERKDYEGVMEELARQGKEPEKVVHTLVVRERKEGVRAEERISDEAERGFYSVVRLAQAIWKLGVGRKVDMVVLTSGVEDVSGEDEIEAERAMVTGACKVIPQEYPSISCRYIDIVPPTDNWRRKKLIEQLISEIRIWLSDAVVAYRGGRRWVQEYEAVKLGTVAEGAGLRQSGVYLITGGLGRVGMALGQYLARSVKAKLVITSRQGLPERSQWEEWIREHGEEDEVSRRIVGVRELEEIGAEVEVMKADVAEEEQMSEVVSSARQRFGRINGVIHAAGVTGEEFLRAIEEISPANCEWLFRPKTHGLLVLETLFRDSDLDFCFLLSSLSSVLGGLGFAAYCSSNIFMDAFAQKYSGAPGVRWISINWDGWQTSQDNSKNNNAFGATVTQFAITPAEGAVAFQRVLASSLMGRVVVSTGHLQSRIDQWIKSDSLRQPQRQTGKDSSLLHKRPELNQDYLAPRDELEQTIATIWQNLLGVEKIGVHDNFIELGGHSLLAIQVTSCLRDAFQVNVSIRTFFEKLTVAQQAEVIEEALIEEIEALSEEDAERFANKE